MTLPIVCIFNSSIAVLADHSSANFIAFLKTLNVPTEPTDMTFSVSRDGGRFEWAGKNLFTVFAQKRNLFSPRMWRMLFDIIRFNQYALDLLINSVDAEATGDHDNSSVCSCPKNHQQQPRHLYSHSETIGDYLEREEYSDAFRDDYLIPMTAAVWSTSPDKCTLQFPALTLVRFL
jgi:predicted NAD/FAD-binding protein